MKPNDIDPSHRWPGDRYAVPFSGSREVIDTENENEIVYTAGSYMEACAAAFYANQREKAFKEADR